LKTTGSDYLGNLFYPKKQRIIRYNSKRLPVGRTKNGRIWHIDLSEALRILAIGTLRSGKSFLMRSLKDRLQKTGSNVFFPVDVKDEFKTSKYPLQNKFHNILLENEKPMGLKTVTFRPTFFKDLGKKLPKDNYWLSFNPEKMVKKDFMTLFKTEKLRYTQQQVMHQIYDRLREKIREEDTFHPKMLMDVVNNMEQLKENQITPFENLFYPLLNSGFYEPEYDISVVEALKRGYTPIINMDYYDDFDANSYAFPFVFFSIMLRDVISARKSGYLKNNLWVMIDEAARFIPSNKDYCSTVDVKESVDRDAAFGINYFFATQVISSIPKSITDQCRYIFVPFSANTDLIRDVLVQVGLFKNHQTVRPQAAKLKKQLGKHEWLAIDSNTMKYDIIKPLPPLTHHQETKQ